MFIGIEISASENALFDTKGDIIEQKENLEAKNNQGFVKLLQAKSEYFKAFKDDFIKKIDKKVGSNEELKK